MRNRVLYVLFDVGLCMRLETHLTHKLGWFEHFNDPDTALSYLLRYIAPLVCCVECSISIAL
jgi:hypothetical protein